MFVLSIKVPIPKKSGNLFNDPRKLHWLFDWLSVCYDIPVSVYYNDVWKQVWESFKIIIYITI